MAFGQNGHCGHNAASRVMVLKFETGPVIHQLLMVAKTVKEYPMKPRNVTLEYVVVSIFTCWMKKRLDCYDMAYSHFFLH